MRLLYRLLPFLSGNASSDLGALERRLGYRFKNLAYLHQALTHKSFTDVSHENLERLEFLGDAILSHVVSVYLFEYMPLATEGEMTLQRSALVNKTYLAGIGETLELQQFLHVNSGVQLNDAKVRRNLIGDAVEAVIGAIYLDGGMAPTSNFIRQKVILMAHESLDNMNYKGKLIELCHQRELGAPRFQLVNTRGPEHDKNFVVKVRLGKRSFKSAQANNKKAAEQEAAALALLELEG